MTTATKHTHNTPRWKHRANAFVRSFTRNKEGAVMVEFALIAAPFFILIFGLIEIALIFLMTTTLDYGVTQASRQIRTGQIQERAGLESDFRALVCGNLFDLLACDKRLHIDVRRYDDFVSSNAGDKLPLKPDGTLDDNFQYNPGGPSEIVLVQVYYEWSLVTPVLSSGLKNMSDSKRLLHSTAVFRNEPF